MSKTETKEVRRQESEFRIVKNWTSNIQHRILNEKQSSFFYWTFDVGRSMLNVQYLDSIFQPQKNNYEPIIFTEGFYPARAHFIYRHPFHSARDYLCNTKHGLQNMGERGAGYRKDSEGAGSHESLKQRD